MTALLDPEPEPGIIAQTHSQLALVTSVRLEADDIVSITFTDPDRRELPEWQPGAHIEVELPSGLLRLYSLCGRPDERYEYKVAVLREPQGRGGSLEIHDTALVGRQVRMNGPRNRFELKPSGRYLFIAGGIGITPILAMARSVGDSAPWTLHYGGRSSSSMAFVDELKELGRERVNLWPQDVHGLLDLDRILGSADRQTAIYCCGPAAMLTAIQEHCARYAPDVPVYTERFGSLPTPKPPAIFVDSERSFELELRRTGVTVLVGPHQSALDAIREVIPDMPFSCTEGYCGSCEAAVLEGTPDHRDEILTPDERERGRTMFPCVSRCLSDRLVLDV